PHLLVRSMLGCVTQAVRPRAPIRLQWDSVGRRPDYYGSPAMVQTPNTRRCVCDRSCYAHSIASRDVDPESAVRSVIFSCGQEMNTTRIRPEGDKDCRVALKLDLCAGSGNGLNRWRGGKRCCCRLCH